MEVCRDIVDPLTDGVFSRHWLFFCLVFGPQGIPNSPPARKKGNENFVNWSTTAHEPRVYFFTNGVDVWMLMLKSIKVTLLPCNSIVLSIESAWGGKYGFMLALLGQIFDYLRVTFDRHALGVPAGASFRKNMKNNMFSYGNACHYFWTFGWPVVGEDTSSLQAPILGPV